jgi:hypothetical protein
MHRRALGMLRSAKRQSAHMLLTSAARWRTRATSANWRMPGMARYPNHNEVPSCTRPRRGRAAANAPA